MPVVPCFDPTTGASGGPAPAPVAGGPLTVLDIDWPTLWVDNGSADVDLSAAGVYALGGTSFRVRQAHSGVTATLTSAGLRIVQTPGTSFDWSIALDTNKAADIADYIVLTADIVATVSSRLSGTAGNGVYAVGYTTNPNWTNQPGNVAVGGGIRIQNNTQQQQTTVVRNVTSYGATNTVTKVNPTTFRNRWFATGTDYMGAVNASPFTDAALVPPGTLNMNSTYTLPNTNYPFQHAYRSDAYPMFWTSGNGNLDLDLTVTKTTWIAWAEA